MKKQKLQIREPKKCWVNETQKICYDTELEARGAAAVAEAEHALARGSLGVYRCEYGDHWHLAHGR